MLGGPRPRLTSSRYVSGGLRKNQSLCHETIRWKSDVPLTEGQLRSKRDEFWDTAPAFEGRKEIWDALRAAAVAAEAMDFQLAQAILDGASVSVPNGYLTECYDEWGTRYQVCTLPCCLSTSGCNSHETNSDIHSIIVLVCHNHIFCTHFTYESCLCVGIGIKKSLD